MKRGVKTDNCDELALFARLYSRQRAVFLLSAQRPQTRHSRLSPVPNLNVWTLRSGVEVPWVETITLRIRLEETDVRLGHVFGRTTRREQCYDNLRISKNAFDTNLVKANPRYLSVNWEASGGGAFAVIPLEERGKLPEQLPLFRGHTAAVLDTDWSPFDDSIVASGSEDGKVFLWKVPEDFTLFTDAEEPADVKPVGKLSGHSR